MELLLAAAPAFLASLVEAVEALTIVLAVGVTRQWRGALYGVAAALVTLTVLVAIFGTAIVLFVPIDVLRVVIGTLLLIYGLQWTVKAILRGSGAKALHDEERIYAEQVGRLREEPPVPATGLDGISFTVAFKGVLLEGLEVAFIVITFGASAGQLGPAAFGAALAVVLVVVARHRHQQAAGARAGERAQVRRRHDAHHVRHVLGRRGDRHRVARRRSDPSDPARHLRGHRACRDLARPGLAGPPTRGTGRDRRGGGLTAMSAR